MHAVMNENSEVMHVTVKLKRWASERVWLCTAYHSESKKEVAMW